MEFIIVLVVLAVVAVLVTAPIWRVRPEAEAVVAPGEEGVLAELEAARDAKYREIRDAELDHQTGKLSDADFDAVNATLRAEAIEILRAIDRAGGSSSDSPPEDE